MDITVRNLVSYGRYPHLKFGQRLSKEDNEIIDWAIEKKLKYPSSQIDI